MCSITVRLMIAILTFSVGLTVPRLTSTYSGMEATLVNYLASSPNFDALHSEALDSNPAGKDSDPDLASEISFERIYDGCENCPDRKIVFRREGSKKFEDATVTEIDLHSKKERRGRLGAYYFNNLLRLIEAQGYFSMNNQYAMGWVDSVIVTISVRIGDKLKVIKTRSEGDVPIQLWGIYYAVEGAFGNVKWEN
jgi:hypothetical protein